MRKCLRCGENMKEGYGLKVSNMTAMATVLLSQGKGIFSDEIGNVKVAVCPNCGELSIYVDDVHKIKK